MPGTKPRLAGKGGAAIGQFANLSSFAERMLYPERSLVKIRKEMPLDRAALIGCGGAVARCLVCRRWAKRG